MSRGSVLVEQALVPAIVWTQRYFGNDSTRVIADSGTLSRIIVTMIMKRTYETMDLGPRYPTVSSCPKWQVNALAVPL